jgi:hypothetical protein
LHYLRVDPDDAFPLALTVPWRELEMLTDSFDTLEKRDLAGYRWGWSYAEVVRFDDMYVALYCMERLEKCQLISNAKGGHE